MSNDTNTNTITPSMMCPLLVTINGIIAVAAMVISNQQPIDGTIIFAAVVLVTATLIRWKYRYNGYRLV